MSEGRDLERSRNREAGLLAEAIYWRDRVIDDARGEQGRATAEQQVSLDLIDEVRRLGRS